MYDVNDDDKFAVVPADFPVTDAMGAVAGHQVKLLLVEYHGKFYSPGTSPPERYERWDICEDLAQQISVKCRESKAGKCAHMSEAEILEKYRTRLMKTGWGSEAEMFWTICRVATLLEWPFAARAC